MFSKPNSLYELKTINVVFKLRMNVKNNKNEKRQQQIKNQELEKHSENNPKLNMKHMIWFSDNLWFYEYC